MRKLSLMLFTCISFLFASAQTQTADSLRNAKKDSTLRATIHADSMKIEKEFAETEKWEKLLAGAQYPLLKEAKMGGVMPIKDITEIPDPAIEYKLLFELVDSNPDSVKTEIDYGLAEVARVINMHVAAGIPAKKIIPVIVVHASALTSISTNEYYQRKFKKDNANIKLIGELKNMGTKFIACGQAMTFFEVKKEELLPMVKISLTAQTVLSAYQTKGYVLYYMGSKGK